MARGFAPDSLGECSYGSYRFSVFGRLDMFGRLDIERSLLSRRCFSLEFGSRSNGGVHDMVRRRLEAKRAT